MSKVDQLIIKEDRLIKISYGQLGVFVATIFAIAVWVGTLQNEMAQAMNEIGAQGGEITQNRDKIASVLMDIADRLSHIEGVLEEIRRTK